MPKIRPIKGIRYNPKLQSDLSDLLAPPYDVISLPLRKQLLEKNEHNCVRLIIGDPNALPAEITEDPERYNNVAQLLHHWRQKNILTPFEEDCFIVLEENFEWNGEQISRIGVLNLIELGELGQNNLYGHERTLKKPAQDRLNMLQATKTQLSPVLFMIQDSDQSFESSLRNAMNRTCDMEFKSSDNVVSYQAWFVSDTESVEKIKNASSDKQFLIADGHHRYSTALQFSKEFKTDESKWALNYLCPAGQKGLILSSIQRFVKTDQSLSSALKNLEKYFEAQEIKSDWETFLASNAPMACMDKEKIYALFPKQNALSTIEQDLQDIPTVLLSQLVLNETFKLDVDKPEDQKRIQYFKAVQAMNDHFKNVQGIGFWVRPLSTDRVFELTKKNYFLPPKSTLFFPKIQTGIAFHPC